MMAAADEKYSRLLSLLENYPKLAVAFSGGVDSTLLLHAALRALGRSGVVAYHLGSVLQSQRSEKRCRDVLRSNFPPDLQYIKLEMAPLDWSDFVVNDQSRCYLCKKRMFSAILEAMASQGCALLADGTNADDRLSSRPGLRAINELAVNSPLAEAGFSKEEVRQIAFREGLNNYQFPANSCLATRLAEGLTITPEWLEFIENAENFLEDMGFFGCRVRIHSSCLEIAVLEKDMDAICAPETRHRLRQYFSALLPLPVMLALAGR